MRWRLQCWPEEHMSTVVLEFVQGGSGRQRDGKQAAADSDDEEETGAGTQLRLTQSSIPTCFLAVTEQAWRERFFIPIRQTFGFGARLF